MLLELQDELDSTVKTWNNHVIRPSRNPNVPSGRPNIMYEVPRIYLTYDYKQNVDVNELNACQNECLSRSTFPCDEDVYNVCIFLMQDRSLNMPTNPYNGVDLFMHLRDSVKELLQ